MKKLRIKNPRLSIVTVCYNSSYTLERTFLSVLNQSRLPYEYVVIDGGSKDRSLDIILKYEKLFIDKNVLFHYISEPDQGLYDAMNKALFFVSGDWVHYLNSDDQYYSNEVLSTILMKLCDCSSDIVTGNMCIYSDEKKIKTCKPTFFSRRIAMYFTCPLQQPATFVKSELMKQIEFDISYRNSADYKLWVMLIMKGATSKYVNEDITIFNVGGASSNLRNMNNENIRLFNELNLPLGSVIHRCYVHMYLAYYLKRKFPLIHSFLKRIF